MTRRLRTLALGTGLFGLIPVAAFAQGAGGYDWSGFYAGATLGVVHRGDSDTATYPDTASNGTDYRFSGGNLYLGGTEMDAGLPTAFTLDRLGGAVGLDAGYNFTSGNFVYGVEGDFDLLNAPHALTSGVSAGLGTTVSFDDTLNSLATLRGRVGISADRLLLFATAGLATGQSSMSTSLRYADLGKHSATLDGSGSGTSFGYVAGIGGEYAATDHVTFKAQALYYDLGSISATATGSGFDHTTAVGASPYTATDHPTGVLVSTGVNFKF